MQTQTLDFFFFMCYYWKGTQDESSPTRCSRPPTPRTSALDFHCLLAATLFSLLQKNCSGYTSRVLLLFFRWQPQIQATTLLTPVHNQIISLFFIFCQEMILVGYLMRWTFLLPMLVHNRTCQPSRPNCHTHRHAKDARFKSLSWSDWAGNKERSCAACIPVNHVYLAADARDIFFASRMDPVVIL